MWWSSLPATDAKQGIEGAHLEKEIIAGKTYWFSEQISENVPKSVYLIPPFDEYFVAYKDRSDILDERDKVHMNLGGGMIRGTIIINGIVSGTWKRVLAKKTVHISLNPFTVFTKEEFAAVTKAAESYGRYLSLPITFDD